MKFLFIIIALTVAGSSCTTLKSLDNLNCKLPGSPEQNFIGKWKVKTANNTFIVNFYSDYSCATRENELLTLQQNIGKKEFYVSSWQSDKRDTLRIYYNLPDIDLKSEKQGGLITIPKFPENDRIDYLILSNECKQIYLIDLRTNDTLTLKRKQYFYH